MTHTTDNEIRVELKYCERCGGLWFRREKSNARLCAPCAVEPVDTFLRHRERVIVTPPDRKPPMKAAAWYGPMTETIQRLDAVACTIRTDHRSRAASFGSKLPTPPRPDLPAIAQDFNHGIASVQTHESRRDDWMAGGAA